MDCSAPLNALVGWTWWLKRGDLEPERRDKALDTIDRNAKAVAQLIEDLLDVSRIITGKMRIEARQIDIGAVVEAGMDAVRPSADRSTRSMDPLIRIGRPCLSE